MITFSVYGMPGTKGSARAFVVGSRVQITNDAGEGAKVWAGLVSDAAHEAMAGRKPLAGPVLVETTFYLPRPRSHFLPANRKRPAPQLRPDAPLYVPSKPDGDKMTRATWDALTNIVFHDDAQIAKWMGMKIYADPGKDPVGCWIRIEVL